MVVEKLADVERHHYDGDEPHDADVENSHVSVVVGGVGFASRFWLSVGEIKSDGQLEGGDYRHQ